MTSMPRPPGGRGPGVGAPGDLRAEHGDPTVLLVGADKAFHGAIAKALAAHGVYVETATAHGVLDATVVSAPDLVLLVGDAAADGGSSVLAHLHASPQSSVVPVAILADETALDERLRGFRHGALAVIPRAASVDAIADRIARLAREMPERDGGTTGHVGEATFDELVQALSKELRSGILSVKGPKGSEADTIRVILGGGRPLAQTIDEFVSRLRKHVLHAERLEYEFDERAGGTVQLLGADGLDGATNSDDVAGLRILLADEDAARADTVAQSLRSHGATVVVTDFDPPEARFQRLRQLDPAILLIDENGLRGSGYSLVRRMRRDTRLRWASLLVVRWEEIWSDAEGSAQIARTLGTLATLAEPEHSLKERIEVGAVFDTRLEITGPARLVRALAASAKPLRATIHNARLQVRLEMSDQLVAGARAHARDGSAPLEGALALSALLVLGSGRVHIEQLVEPETVNIMSPIEVALSLADGEASPIQPSLPAPASMHPDATAASSSAPPGELSRRAILVWTLVAFASILVGVAIAALLVASRKKPIAEVPRIVETAEEPAPATTPSVKPALRAAPSSSKLAAAIAKPSRKAEPAPAARPERSAADSAGETAVKALTCEEIVGPSWALLGGDQPGRALAELRLGRRALMLGKLDDAQMSFCRSAVLDPSKPDAFQSLVRLLLLRRDAKQAADWAERATKQHPDDTDMQGLYADALARAGDADRARSIWLEMGRLDPADTAGARLMALTYTRGGDRSVRGADYAQADRLYRRAVLLDPLNGTAAMGLSRVLLVQGQTEAALHWAKRAVDLEPRDPELRVLLGDVEEKMGDVDAAKAEWKTAYDLDPHSYRAASRMLRAAK
ncbi:MAG TPA: tetratricopeptide repeat protein [Polyangiaceae bacterium]|jgi:DNA-binding response OmpR family regulator/tetratricopeptide (TPR) repeat protein|nr:tetratricopeptide repeat protein [Polyangiaceae bacterium]